MEKLLSRVLSVLFHPLLMPTYGTMLFFYLYPMTGIDFPLKVMLLVTLFIFLMTFIIPLSLTFVMLRMNLVNSLEMETRNERILPLFIVAILFYITYYSLKSTGLFIDLQLFILGSTLLIFIAIIINYFTKISIHMIGIGGVTGALIALGMAYPISVISVLNLLFLVAGLLGFARLRLKAHQPFQIYTGFLLALLVMASLFLLL